MNISQDNFEEVENDGGTVTLKPYDIKATVESANSENTFDIGYIYYGEVQAYREELAVYSRTVVYIGVDSKTSENLNYGQLVEGEWYTKAKKTDGYLNVVAVKGNYELGDEFSIYLRNDDDGDGVSVKCIVTGLLEQGANMLSPYVSSVGS